MDALQAITRSISHNEIVTVSLDKAGIEELEALCDDSVDVSGDRDRIEFWGTNTDGEHWRVHVMTGQHGQRTTLDNLTDAQISALRDEAFAHGDAVMGYICNVALGQEYTLAELNDNSCLDRSEQLEIEALDQDQARAKVVSVIDSAEAMGDDDTDDEATRRADYDMDQAKDDALEGR